MFGEDKNLKDISSPSPLQGEGWGEVGFQTRDVLSYKKTHKLITALYMVTDIIDKDEPLRNKLRTLGNQILSDIYFIHHDRSENNVSLIMNKIAETMSFLDIASAMNIVSEMNVNILLKEFLELNKAIEKLNPQNRNIGNQINLAEFFREEENADIHPVSQASHPSRGERNYKGHTRIGVQKGSTLLKAIKDMSNKIPVLYEMKVKDTKENVFEVLKKQRRDNITNLIKLNNGTATIKDIKDKVSFGEKTLQRELVSMIQDGVLNKTGEKRWSKYFVKN